MTTEESWEGTPEEKSLQATSGDLGNRHRGCGRDMLGQTVPSTDSSNRECPMANGGQPCRSLRSTTDSQRRRESRAKCSEVSPGLEIDRAVGVTGDTMVLCHADACAQE